MLGQVRDVLTATREIVVNLGPVDNMLALVLKAIDRYGETELSPFWGEFDDDRDDDDDYGEEIIEDCQDGELEEDLVEEYATEGEQSERRWGEEDD